MSSEIAIKVENLSKGYQIYDRPRDRLKQFVLPRLRRAVNVAPKQYFRDFWALKDVSFEVKKGETVGIIGRNGSGKSTLLQMICGTLNPSSGTIQTHGRVAALLELGSGFNPEFTGRENIYLSSSLLGLTQEQTDERFERMAAFADIGTFIDQPIKTYSSGMFVRLAFAVIAHVDADILVIDEALAVGDAFFVQKCMRFLREFVRRGTLIFVSHDVGAVLSLCESAIWLQEGRLRAVGSPKALINGYMQALYEGKEDTVAEIAGHRDAVLSETPSPGPSVALGAGSEVSGDTARTHPRPAAGSLPRDMRADLINASTLRNDIQVFAFQPDAAGFGTGEARIFGVRFDDTKGQPLSLIVGGEAIVLTVDVFCNAALKGPIVGFIVKDRLGQVLFGDNTFLTTLDAPLVVGAGRRLRARFAFTLPRLPKGDYTVSAAIAEGSVVEHRQHHWMHDALSFKVQTSSVYSGLIGIPMSAIELTEVV